MAIEFSLGFCPVLGHWGAVGFGSETFDGPRGQGLFPSLERRGNGLAKG